MSTAQVLTRARQTGGRVTVCIPAWNCAHLLPETLTCVQNQTEQAIEIYISVDNSPDDTLQIAQTAAHCDDRITVFSQRDQQGFGGNTNFLLTQVKTEFYVPVWHDDLISDNYVESLLATLDANSQAVASYAQTQHFGANNYTQDSGRTISGSPSERILSAVSSQELLGLMRCMVRSSALNHQLKIPMRNDLDQFENNHCYWVAILCLGDVVYSPEGQYRRRNGTGRSVVDTWNRQEARRVVSEIEFNYRWCLRLINRLHLTTQEKDILKYALSRFWLWRYRLFERAARTGPEPILSDFGKASVPDDAALEGQGGKQLIGLLTSISNLEREGWAQSLMWKSALQKWMVLAENPKFKDILLPNIGFPLNKRSYRSIPKELEILNRLK